MIAQTGMARAIYPVHAPLDGDVVFAAATGEEADRSAVRSHRTRHGGGQYGGPRDCARRPFGDRAALSRRATGVAGSLRLSVSSSGYRFASENASTRIQASQSVQALTESDAVAEVEIALGLALDHLLDEIVGGCGGAGTSTPARQTSSSPSIRRHRSALSWSSRRCWSRPCSMHRRVPASADRSSIHRLPLESPDPSELATW